MVFTVVLTWIFSLKIHIFKNKSSTCIVTKPPINRQEKIMGVICASHGGGDQARRDTQSELSAVSLFNCTACNRNAPSQQLPPQQTQLFRSVYKCVCTVWKFSCLTTICNQLLHVRESHNMSAMLVHSID